MRDITIHWRKDGKRVMSIDYGHKIEEHVIGSVSIKKDKNGKVDCK